MEVVAKVESTPTSSPVVKQAPTLSPEELAAK